MPITTQSSEQPWQLTDDDVWDILDPQRVLRDSEIRVSKEWLENAIFELSLFVDIDNDTNATLALLLILRTAIDLYEYHRVAYLKGNFLGGIIEYNFYSITHKAFKAANKEQFYSMALSYVVRNEFIEYIMKPIRPLYGTWNINVPMDNILSLSIQGKRFIRQRVGDLADLPKIEPDGFKNYNPHGVINEKDNNAPIGSIMIPEPPATQAQVAEPQTRTIFQRLKQRLRRGNSETINNNSMAQAISKGGDVAIVNAPVFNNPPVDLSPLAEAQKYGFDIIRSAIEASHQPITAPPPAPEPPPKEQNDANNDERDDSEAIPLSNLKKTRRSGPGKPPDYTDKEKSEILQQYKIARASDEKRDAFIERLAREQDKPVQEIRKMLEAAARGARRKRQK